VLCIASIDSELSEKLIILGVILALMGLVLLLIVALILGVAPTSYNNNVGTMKNTIYTGIILIAIGGGLAVVLYVRE
jgi:hypothetical protein